MQTPIGQGLKRSPQVRVAATAVAVGVVAADMALVRWMPSLFDLGRGTLAVLSIAVLLPLAGGDAASLGLTSRTIQGSWFWVRTGLLIVIALTALVGIVAGIWYVFGREFPVYSTAPDAAFRRFLPMCVFVPVLEEAIYRLALCVPLVASVGTWGAVFVSGLVFGYLHVLYGNPSPENLVGGFFLAWAFLKSGSIYVPILLHGLGNVCALAGQIAAWHWLGGSW